MFTFIGIYLDTCTRGKETIKQLEKIPEVIECHYTTGNWNTLNYFVRITTFSDLVKPKNSKYRRCIKDRDLYFAKSTDQKANSIVGDPF